MLTRLPAAELLRFNVLSEIKLRVSDWKLGWNRPAIMLDPERLIGFFISNGGKMKNNLDSMRHSCGHVMTMAVLKFFPKAKMGVGPAIQNGYYQDFELDRPLIPQDLKKIEKEMYQIRAKKYKFIHEEWPVKKALDFYKKHNQPYKVELINDLIADNPKLKTVSIYKTGDYIDLCAGPHIESSDKIGEFKLLSIAGAYWRGDEKNKMLQRIYGTCFSSKKELDDYLAMLEEAKKRDHRKLGKDLGIFFFSDLVGPGLPMWLPKGTVVIDELERLAIKMEKEAGYVRVRTPHIAKKEMYLTSGHLPYYKDSMFPPMELLEDGKKMTYYLKAMNCPHHHQIYAHAPKSYRELPIRLAEYGTCYRYEKSGELFGLMRVRSLQMNDAHIYCTEEQFESEFMAVIKLYQEYFKIFNIKKYVMRLSTHDKKGLGKKYIDNEKLWLKTEHMVRSAMKKSKIPFVEVPNEAAFYGPKIDVEIWSVIGKEFTLATNQVDFAVPERFGLTYVDEKGKEKTPICIHRAPLSTHERMIGFLLEHYAGAFPVWLAPVQAMVLTISEKQIKFSQEVIKKLLEAGIRVELDDRNESVGKKIREAEMQKIPYILVIGDKEVQAKSVAVRERGKGDLGAIKLDKFIEKINKEIELKK